MHTPFPLTYRFIQSGLLFWLLLYCSQSTTNTVHLSGDPCNSYDIRCGFFDHRSCRRLLIVGFKNKHIVSWTLFKCDIFFHSIFCIKWPVIIVYLNAWQDQSIIFRVLRLESPNWWFRSDESHTFYFTYRFIIVDIWSCNKRCWPLRALQCTH